MRLLRYRGLPFFVFFEAVFDLKTNNPNSPLSSLQPCKLIRRRTFNLRGRLQQTPPAGLLFREPLRQSSRLIGWMNEKAIMKLTWMTIPMVCLGTLATGCVERRVEYVPAPQPQAVTAPTTPPDNAPVVAEAPPAPQVEVVPVAPGPEYAWTPGYWSIGVGGRWVWIGGRYVVRPRAHAIWVGGHWARRGRGYVWIGGHWR